MDQSINQSIQKVLTLRRGQHCANNNST